MKWEGEKNTIHLDYEKSQQNEKIVDQYLIASFSESEFKEKVKWYNQKLKNVPAESRSLFAEELLLFDYCKKAPVPSNFSGMDFFKKIKVGKLNYIEHLKYNEKYGIESLSIKPPFFTMAVPKTCEARFENGKLKFQIWRLDSYLGPGNEDRTGEYKDGKEPTYEMGGYDSISKAEAFVQKECGG